MSRLVPERWTVLAPSQYRQTATMIQDLAILGRREMWSYSRLHSELIAIGLSDQKNALEAFVGNEDDWAFSMYSLSALNARWPDAKRESARVVPDSARNQF